jgi:hypothetical protein
LPTFSGLAVGTSVSVPDGGSALLGGAGRGAEGRAQFGVPGVPGGTRATGHERGATMANVQATVHDLNAMDERILGFTPERANGPAGKPRDRARKRLAEAQASSAGRAAPGVADARRLHDAEQAQRNEEARGWFEQGLKAESSDKVGLARVYYRMAARQASGPLRQQIAERLERLGKSDGAAEAAEP